MKSEDTMPKQGLEGLVTYETLGQESWNWEETTKCMKVIYEHSYFLAIQVVE